MNNKYLFTQNHSRLTYIRSNNGTAYNWLFLPGGPGMDAKMFADFTQSLEIPGTIWHIDLPGSGDNTVDANEPWAHWKTELLEIVKLFDNPILVGQSYGSMLALSIPELKKYLAGFVALHSSPQLWLPIQQRYMEKYKLPDSSPGFEKFMGNPNQKSFKDAMKNQIHYCFTTSEKGKKASEFVFSLSQPYQVVEWNFHNFFSTYDAKWIPDNMPVLVVTGDKDYATPPECFIEDERFNLNNVHYAHLKDVSHFSWLEDPIQVKVAFENFANNYL